MLKLQLVSLAWDDTNSPGLILEKGRMVMWPRRVCDHPFGHADVLLQQRQGHEWEQVKQGWALHFYTNLQKEGRQPYMDKMHHPPFTFFHEAGTIKDNTHNAESSQWQRTKQKTTQTSNPVWLRHQLWPHHSWLTAWKYHMKYSLNK